MVQPVSLEAFHNLPSDYARIDMHDRSDPHVWDDGSIQIYRKFDPIYFELGHSVVALTREVDPSVKVAGVPVQSYHFTNLTTPGGELSLPSSQDTRQPGLIIGRVATPELKLDDTASGRHFSIVTMVTGMKLEDLGSLNSTIVHTNKAVEAFTRLIGRPQQT